MNGDRLESVDALTLNLSLVSHTNVGKTSLARTLVRGDVGDVLDQAHVTEESEAYTLLETSAGERLELWDTPGFGDSARLLRRLKREKSGLNWLVSQVWDRFSNRAMWCSQQAIRNVRERADVVLYLVNAAEDPEDAGYLELEMEVLGWTEKPVLILLNQTGPVRPAGEREVDLKRWSDYSTRFPFVRSVLELDAFSRCWVQEGVLFERVGEVLPPERARLLQRLLGEWHRRTESIFEAAMDELAGHLARTARDREALEGSGPDLLNAARRNAMKNLALRVEESLTSAVDRLIGLHGLEGEAVVEVKSDIADYTLPPDEKKVWKHGLIGGVVSGALSGLGADIAVGGLSFGGGFVAGAILGALGAAGATRGLSILGGRNELKLAAWTPAFLEELFIDACLRYLAVAHFGRGTGRYSKRREPAFWRESISEAVERQRSRLKHVWSSAGQEPSPEEAALAAELKPLLAGVCRQVLELEVPKVSPK